MRKIFGPTRTDDGYWKIKTDEEINDILKGQNIIWFIKKQRLNWLGHVECMAEDNNVQKIKRWKLMSRRPIGRPKTRWEDDFWKIQRARTQAIGRKQHRTEKVGRKYLSKPEPCTGCSGLEEEEEEEEEEEDDDDEDEEKEEDQNVLLQGRIMQVKKLWDFSNKHYLNACP